MKKVLFCFFLAASALLAVGNDFDIWLSDAVVTGKTVELNSEFMQAAGAGKQNLRKSFKHSFRAAFANTIDKIEPQKRRSTAAAFLSIVRASKYEVLMDNSNVAVYTLPVTATINFVNISNGELLYSQAYTHIATIETTKDDANIKTKIIKAYLETTDELITELANAAKTKFVPKRLSVKAIGIEHGMIILDKGLSGGIAEGDSLDGDGGALIKVKYSAQNYAVAKEELGKAKVGSVFTKTYSQSLEDIKKPKVTLLDIKYDDKKLTVSENMLYQFFAEKLAQKGSFALLPINKNFYTAINALQGSANLGIRFTKRAVPEYFMRLYIDGPYFYDAPTNVNYAKQRVYQTTICGEILDGSARVVGSDCKTEKILDEIKFGKAFSKEARFEVLAKNAAISLANEFASKVSFEPISYKVTGINNEAIELLDEKNLLSLGSTVTIFKNLGNIGDKQNVYLPIVEAVVEKKDGDKVYAKEIIKSFSGAPNAEKGDVVLETVVKSASDTLKLFNICAMPSNLGGESIEGFEEISKFLAPKHLKYPFYNDTDLQKSIDAKISESEFEGVPKITTPKRAYCINPAYKYTKISAESSSEHIGFTELKYDAITGVKEFFGTELKNKYALGGKITEYAPNAFVSEFMRLKLLELSITSLETSMKELEIK